VQHGSVREGRRGDDQRAGAKFIRRRQPSSSTVQSFCLTFSQRVVRPLSYTSPRPPDVALEAGLEHLAPRHEAVRCQPPHREDPLSVRHDLLEPRSAVS
jgi:hypothetical protein